MSQSPVVLEIPYSDPAAAFAPFAGDPYSVLLDNPSGTGRYAYIAADPVRTVAGDGWEGIAELLEHARCEPVPGLPPFQTGVVAVFGYELGRYLERLPAPRDAGAAWPEAVAGLYDTIAAFDSETAKAWIVSVGPDATRRADAMAARIAAAPAALPGPEVPPAAWRAEIARDAYEAKAARIVEYTRAGDIFQANLTQRFIADRPNGLDPYALYRRLRAESPAPYAAFLRLDESRALLSASPERFLRLAADGMVTTEPIKGSRPRGSTAEEDRALAEELSASAKDRAENLMIVDLLRNDLSRVCRIGSVAVPSLNRLERFASMHHLVSTVTGRLDDGRTALELLKACFPGGSVTGAPKIRAMEIIHELEPARRGPYCGAIGWIGRDGAMETSILIRTLTVDSDHIIAQAGGGIVADSDPAAEYLESLEKARPLLRCLDPEGKTGSW
jgi:para-aminobenzoate synthetase component 1